MNKILIIMFLIVSFWVVSLSFFCYDMISDINELSKNCQDAGFDGFSRGTIAKQAYCYNVSENGIVTDIAYVKPIHKQKGGSGE